MNEIEVIDNFLSEEIFEKLKEIFDTGVPWVFSEVVYESDRLCDPKYNFQYVHIVYTHHEPRSKYYNNILPVLEKLNVRSIIRSKVNSICRQEEIITHGFHTDITFPDSPEGENGCKTSILYLNTNDGFTVFENGTKVESVANRLVTFPATYKHSGTTCTDVHRRVALNIVYF